MLSSLLEGWREVVMIRGGAGGLGCTIQVKKRALLRAEFAELSRAFICGNVPGATIAAISRAHIRRHCIIGRNHGAFLLRCHSRDIARRLG